MQMHIIIPLYITPFTPLCQQNKPFYDLYKNVIFAKINTKTHNIRVRFMAHFTLSFSQKMLFMFNVTIIMKYILKF